MLEKLVNIHNDLMTVEVKGQSVLTLAGCIYEIRAMVEEEKVRQQEAEPVVEVIG